MFPEAGALIEFCYDHPHVGWLLSKSSVEPLARFLHFFSASSNKFSISAALGCSYDSKRSHCFLATVRWWLKNVESQVLCKERCET